LDASHCVRWSGSRCRYGDSSSAPRPVQGEACTYYYWNEWTWNVFDQVILSPGLLDGRGLEYVHGSLQVHAPEFLRDTKENAHRPAPFRKFRGNWDEGYSDHFAVRGELRRY